MKKQDIIALKVEHNSPTKENPLIETIRIGILLCNGNIRIHEFKYECVGGKIKVI